MPYFNLRSLYSQLIISYLLLTFFLLAIVAGISAWKASESLTELALKEVQYNAEIKAKQIKASIHQYTDGLLALAKTPPPAAIIRAVQNGGIDPESQDDIPTWRDRFMTILEVHAHNKNYQQLRFLDKNGYVKWTPKSRQKTR